MEKERELCDVFLRMAQAACPPWVNSLLRLQTWPDIVPLSTTLNEVLTHAHRDLQANLPAIQAALDRARFLAKAVPKSAPYYNAVAALTEQNIPSVQAALAAQQDILRCLENNIPLPQHLRAFTAWKRLNQTWCDAIRDSLLAQAFVLRFPLEDLAKRITAPLESISRLRSSHIALVNSYTQLYSQLLKHVQQQVAIPQSLTFTPRSFLSHANVIEFISVSEEDELLSTVRHELIYVDTGDIDRILEERLEDVDPRLIPLLHGANEALSSSSPDHLRHFSVSGRELIDHLLRTLADDEAIVSWSNNPQHFKDKRPTRRARIEYILRNIQSENLKDFIKKDIDAFLTFVNVLQEGTHSLCSNELEDFELALLWRLKIMLLELLIAVIRPSK